MSDTNSIPEKVLAKIQKLMAIAKAGEGRVNEHEAANAASMAQELASQFNLELAHLELTSSETTPGGKREKKSHDRAAMYKFQRDLMNAIAEVNFCRHWVTEEYVYSFGKERRVKRHTLLGRDINVRATVMIYDYLMDTMDRLLPYTGMEKRGRDALLWLAGCTDRLALRLAAKKEAMLAEGKRKRAEEEARAKHPGAAPSTNALVLSDVYSSENDYNHDFEMGWEPGTTARRRKVREAQNAANEALREAKVKALVEAGYDELIAKYISWGYDEKKARELAHPEPKASPKPKPETEAQARKRREREERESRNYHYRQSKRNAKYYTEAYKAGSSQGDNIGLDDQVTGQERRGIK